jgi:hypothetical protein
MVSLESAGPGISIGSLKGHKPHAHLHMSPLVSALEHLSGSLPISFSENVMAGDPQRHYIFMWQSGP